MDGTGKCMLLYAPLAHSITIKYPPGKRLAIFVQLKALNSSHEVNKFKTKCSNHTQELSVGQRARLFSMLDSKKMGHNIVKKLDTVTTSVHRLRI
jgi:hypothetical protein